MTGFLSEMFMHTRELPIKSSRLLLIPGSGFFGGGDVLYYLVIDGWNNRRHTNTDATGGDVDVEILIDVEDRLNIPKFTATLLVGSLPLACIIATIDYSF